MTNTAAGDAPANASLRRHSDGEDARRLLGGNPVAGFGALSDRSANGDEVHRFSHLQWYLANARNHVHLIILVKERLTRADFARIVQQCILRAPQLLHSENTVQGTHQRAPDMPEGGRIPGPELLEKAGVLSWREVDRLGELPGSLYPLTDHPFEPGRPAFRATCQVAGNANADGIRSAIVFETVHSLIEGGDISAALRGHQAGHQHREAGAGGHTALESLAANLLAPLLAGMHLGFSRLEKRRREDFAFHAFGADIRDIARAARRHGVSRRAFIFASVLYPLAMARKSSPERLFFTYSTLTRRPLRLDGDDFLNVRMDEMRFGGQPGFSDYLKALDAGLSQRKESAVFTQYLYNKVIAVHRFLQPRMPRIYNEHFFGFSPHDIVLSLVPPLRPRGAFGQFADARLFAGSQTGRVANCIFMPARDEVTYNFAADARVASCLPAIRSLMESEGIGLRE